MALNTSRIRAERLCHKPDVCVGMWKISGKDSCALKESNFVLIDFRYGV